MKRSVSAVLLALSLLLTGACSGSQSGGGSNPDNQFDEKPGSDESRAPVLVPGSLVRVSPVPELVTLHLWRVEPAGVPRALLRMARDRARVRRTDGLRFAKLLGTGDGRTFTVRDADPLRWGLLATWTSVDAARAFDRRSPVAAAWRRLAVETWRVDLRPVASRGTWSGRQPFGDPVPRRSDGPVAALTRARLRPAVAASFWRAVPPVSADLRERPGLRAAVGVGEAPLGLQGTFSLWESGAAVREFARGPAHAAVVARTGPERWYAEELFARFDVVGSAGTLGGRDPLA